uniref:NADH-ubiquinone oxidoreductase chain 2 n=2 Tax=Craugastor TaxID=228649 RepID=Q53EE4_9NEOB|nr:NADH dehydrogenase subunit II [Craugastor cf. fitzingeri SIUC H-06964]ACD80057.1 NADH dehydrogenase subunit II [Craugastor noblei]
MNPYALLIFTLSLAAGSVITISSHHWMLAWLGLEINALAIIPLMVKTPHPRAIEAATKYFLVQATASAMLIFACTLNAWLTGEWVITLNLENTPTNFLTIALMMKLGIAPFHFWMPDVLQGLTLMTGLILSTWMKLPPTILLFQLNDALNLDLLLIVGLLSTVIGGWGGINQTQIRKILAFSSIAHLGWMTAVLKLSPQLAMFNFTIYVLLTSTLFITLMSLDTKNLPKLMSSWTKSPTLTSLTLLTLLSLSGLPPLTGFLPKWLVAQEMMKQHLTLIVMIMLLSSLLSMFFYLRLTYVMALTMSPHTSFSLTTWTYCPKTPTALLITLSILLIPILPLIFPLS